MFLRLTIGEVVQEFIESEGFPDYSCAQGENWCSQCEEIGEEFYSLFRAAYDEHDFCEAILTNQNLQAFLGILNTLISAYNYTYVLRVSGSMDTLVYSTQGCSLQGHAL